MQEYMRVLLLHLIFAFPREFWPTLCVPPYLHDRDATLLSTLHLPVHDLDWFFDEQEILIDFDFVERNDKGFV